ncbi:MAG: glycosyltransferase family 2 protein [Deltaproteobacteria bacterium]|nr:glycosyltransferase family 2 protein [Deltaproteobacteria bacterium]
MPYANVYIDLCFLSAAIGIWLFLLFNVLLTFFAFLNGLSSEKERARLFSESFPFPFVSILIPAHNEELVIERTVQAMLALNYPKERLEIIVVNDGSKDRTGDVVAEIAARHREVKLVTVPEGEGGKGKSRTLNVGLEHAMGDVIAVYDADNRPEPDALRYLVANLVEDPKLGAVLGKVRTINRDRNSLTRFINLEFISFQWLMQGGRYKLFNLATLPGTNYVIWRKVLDKAGRFDEEAIAEDAELSIRLYEMGYRIKFIPYSVTWEQEPEDVKTFVRQRTRWVQGMTYIVRKFLKVAFQMKNRRIMFDLFYMFSLYYVFFFALILSDVIAVLGLLGFIKLGLVGPFTFIWFLAMMLFFMQSLIAMSLEEEESFLNILLSLIMYVTYCQVWIVIVFRAFWIDVIRRRKGTVWEKTIRYKMREKQADG